MEFLKTIFKYTRGIIAFIVVVFSFGFLFSLIYRPIPAENKETLNLAAGLILAVLATIISYYFGNSKDKSDQDQKGIYETKQTNLYPMPSPPGEEGV